MTPTTMEWSRAGSPWTPVPCAGPLWGSFTTDERALLAAGHELHLDTGTLWRVPTDHLAPQRTLF